jgi:hypothetical protein
MVDQLETAATWEAAPGTPRRARLLVEELLRRGGLGELVPTATLLTSEVVTNAVLHIGGPITLRVSCRPGTVRVEVCDTGEQFAVPGAPSEGATAGRGLQLVEALASDWGTTGDASGKTVWFELAATEARQASSG